MWLNTTVAKLENVLLGELEDGAHLTNAHAAEAVADVNGILYRLAEDETCDHTTSERLSLIHI